jgi:hypothetical protein
MKNLTDSIKTIKIKQSITEYSDLRNKVLSTHLESLYGVKVFRAYIRSKMRTKMQANSDRRYRRIQIETTMDRLNSLKNKVTELRIKCEKLKSQTEKQNENKCRKCKKVITAGEEVIFKNSSRKIIQHFHKNCFEKLITCST